ncbi:citrate synthase [Chelativorans sp. AA-79]|uniref:citrate synthase n=1 Tax=Chelativorans sp. AA-79 TaxID=3028735 RepID=UPI0023F8F0B6|nr:citrate synthase [Chelativorans sp. AA-79]WEX08744.1 citrate synthase [Chelativorans sp. AA-79]
MLRLVMAVAGYIDADEATARLGVKRTTLYAYVSRGVLRAIADPADSHRSLYSSVDVDALTKRKRHGRKPERVAAATLDWGLPVLSSRITLIEHGRLFYRGQDAVELAGHASLEEIARLMWDCGAEDPFAGPAPAVDQAWIRLAAALGNLSVIERAAALLPLVYGSTALTWQRETRRLWPPAVALVRAVAAAAAGTRPTSAPVHTVLADAWKLDKGGADLVRAALVVLADHELNASTFAVRIVASTGASLASALAAGLAALSGPLHGGSTSLVEIFFDEVERSGDAAKVVEERLWRGDRLPGFDHPLYPEGDPRGSALLGMLPLAARRVDVLAAMDRLGKLPNVDFALVALRRALRLPRGAALSLFAVGRTVGWIAHALEQCEEGKLIRPRARYRGQE